MDIDINKIREDVRSGGRSSAPSRPTPSQRPNRQAGSSQQERGFTHKVGGLLIVALLYTFGGAILGGLFVGITGVAKGVAYVFVWIGGFLGLFHGWKGKLGFLPRILEKIVGIIVLIFIGLAVLGAVLNNQ